MDQDVCRPVTASRKSDFQLWTPAGFFGERPYGVAESIVSSGQTRVCTAEGMIPPAVHDLTTGLAHLTLRMQGNSSPEFKQGLVLWGTERFRATRRACQPHTSVGGTV